MQALEETVATTSQPAQATRCKGLREEQAERGYFAALERIERRPKYKKNSGEPDEFDEEQADVLAVANVILAIVPVGFGPAVYDFLRARTTTTASTLNLHALEETVATTSQPAQATRCKGLREEQAHPRRQLVIAVTFTLHKTN